MEPQRPSSGVARDLLSTIFDIALAGRLARLAESTADKILEFCKASRLTVYALPPAGNPRVFLERRARLPGKGGVRVGESDPLPTVVATALAEGRTVLLPQERAPGRGGARRGAPELALPLSGRWRRVGALHMVGHAGAVPPAPRVVRLVETMARLIAVALERPSLAIERESSSPDQALQWGERGALDRYLEAHARAKALAEYEKAGRNIARSARALGVTRARVRGLLAAEMSRGGS